MCVHAIGNFLILGIKEILVDARITGIGNVNSVLKGSDYVTSGRVIDLVAEAMTTLMIEQFLEENNDVDFQHIEEVLIHTEDQNYWAHATVEVNSIIYCNTISISTYYIHDVKCQWVVSALLVF